MTMILRDQWPQFTGEEAVPFSTFVKSHPDDKPDLDTSSLRGWQEVSTNEQLQTIVATQKKFAR